MQRIQLSIPEPCHEDWQQMTPTQQGRYCNACAKQVVDFSTMSDAEVLNYFSNIKNEKVCGRAYPDQLERTIAMPVYPKKKLFWYWNYITMFFLFFAKSNTTKAQGAVKVVTEQKINADKLVDVSQELQGRAGGMVITKVTKIEGRVTTETGDPIPFATVSVKDIKQVTTCDAAGLYSLNCSITNPVLVITAMGYQNAEVAAGNKNVVNIILGKSSDVLQEVVVTAGMILRRSEDLYPVHIVEFKIIDNASMQPVKNASITIKSKADYNTQTVYTDKKGIYKLRKINEYDTYTVSAEAAGFKTEEISIKGNELDKRKIVKQIFLEKEATLSDYKQMDSVVINAYPVVGRLKRVNTICESVTMGAMISGITITRTFEDTLNLLATKMTGAVKIYPSPVQKGNSFNLSLKLKETGTYKIQITDAGGRIVLIKEINATAKVYTEQLQTNAVWSSGIYYLSIINNENSLISTGSFSIK